MSDHDGAVASGGGKGEGAPIAESTLPRDIGGFRLLQQIGQGGMGVVYEADSGPLNSMTLRVDGSETNPQLKIPKSFLTPGDPNTDYVFEVIVQEASGNRTVTEIEFSTL